LSQLKPSKIPSTELGIEDRDLILVLSYLNKSKKIRVKKLKDGNVAKILSDGKETFLYTYLPKERLSKEIENIIKNVIPSEEKIKMPSSGTLKKLEDIGAKETTRVIETRIIETQKRIKVCCGKCGYVLSLEEEVYDKVKDDLVCPGCDKPFGNSGEEKKIKTRGMGKGKKAFLLFLSSLSFLGLYQTITMVWAFYSTSAWQTWHPNGWTFSFPFYFELDVSIAFYIVGILPMFVGAITWGYLLRGRSKSHA